MSLYLRLPTSLGEGEVGDGGGGGGKEDRVLE